MTVSRFVVIRRLRVLFDACTEFIHGPVLLLLIVLGVGYGGYRVVQYVRFEHHFAKSVEACDREALDEAGRQLSLCLTIDGDSAAVHFLAAQVARRSREWDLAGEELNAASDLGWPEDQVRLERILLGVQRDELDLPTEIFLRNQVTADNAQRHLVLEVLVHAYVRAQRLTDVLQCAEEWLAVRPDSVNARMKRAWVYERLGKTEDAAADLQFISQLDPRYRPARIRLGQIRLQQKQFADAAAILEALGDNTDPDGELALAQAYNSLGRTDDAKRLLLGLHARLELYSSVCLELGKLALVQGRPTEAREWLVKAIGRSPEEYEPHYQMFLALRQLGDEVGANREERKFKEIEADLKRMSDLSERVQTRPWDASLRFEMAEIFLRRGERAEAARWLTQVVAIDPNHTRARALLVEHHEKTGRPDLARQFHRK